MPEPEIAVTELSEFRERRSEGLAGSSAVAQAPVVPEGAGSVPLPAGTVTFLLTDIEGSTRTWEAHGQEMAAAVARHYEILDAAVASHGGVRPIEQGEGDSLVAAFARASDAVAAALEAQRALVEEDWPAGTALAVRMALHTGEAQLRDERYYTGPSIIRCARLRALAHGGQVLISSTTADLLADGLPEGAALLPLGLHRLRDLRQPERVFQLSHPALPAGFPPLRSLDALPNNLPVQLTSFIGREAELAEVGALVAEHRLVPLAIELAAARVRSLSPERILDGLADRFRLLTGGARTAVARQQTLQASVEWSHHLLSDGERILFRRLAAFSGGFTLEAAEAVGAGDPLEAWEVLGVLSDLVDKSLVVFDGERYRLLQTIHDFANNQLLVSGEADAVRDRHAAYFLSRAESASVQLEREVRTEMLAALEADHDNLRAALEWSVAKADDDLALRLVVALGLFWLIHGHFSEGLSWHRRVLARIPRDPSSLRCKAVWGLGHLSLTCVELTNTFGVAELEEAVTLARQLGDPGLLARPLADQGLIQVYLAPDAAPATMEEALDSARRAGDEWAVSLVLWWQAFYWVFVRNRFDLAEPILAELEGIAQRAGNLSCLRWNDTVTGIAAWYQGRLGDARATLERARAAAYECADPLLEFHAVEWQIGVRIAQGDYEGASALALQTVVRLSRSLDGCRQGFIEFGLAEVALARGDLAEAAGRADVLAPVIREIGLPFKLERLEMLRGRVALTQGNLPAARSAFDAALDIATQSGAPWTLVDAYHCCGLLARAEGDLPAAEDLHHRALALEVQYGFRGVAGETLEALGSLAAAGGSHGEAVRLFGAAQALREATGQRRWPLDQPAYDADVAQLRAALDDEPNAALWKEGMALSLEEAASYASRARGERKRPRTGWAALTPTELEVAALAARGLTNAEIGRRLFISAGTARIHLSHIYAKLGIANRAQLAAEATARGIAEGSPAH